MIKKVIYAILLGIIVSFFFYPLEFTFLPGLNTKKILATIGLLLFGFRTIRSGKGFVEKGIVGSTLFAILFSLVCYVIVNYHGTGDYIYAKYFSSFFVWLFAAYAVCYFLRLCYGSVSLKAITYYLAAVAIFQCISAQLIDEFPGLQEVVDSLTIQNQDFLHSVHRLYGLGASLDNTGVRFAITLLLMSHFIILNSKADGKKGELIFLYIAFIYITIYGNTIARTTTVGALLGIAYILFDIIRNLSLNVKVSAIHATGIAIVILSIAIPLFAYLYAVDPETKQELRFAFEGFFKLVETGHFSTGSTDKLNATMWIWPETTQEWLIGKGKFDDFAYNTDIGYCRFILYVGITGFSCFVAFFIYNAVYFIKKYKEVTILGLALLSLTFIIWIKVSTDIFQIYALLFCADGIIQNKK